MREPTKIMPHHTVQMLLDEVTRDDIPLSAHSFTFESGADVFLCVASGEVGEMVKRLVLGLMDRLRETEGVEHGEVAYQVTPDENLN